jgi:predicted  nucleic acid-binding Zn-ribbon protein
VADPTLFELGTLGASGLALLVSSWKGLAKRNVDALDKTIVDLTTAVDSLRKELRDLRDTDIGQAKDIGNLQSAVAGLEKRIDGQGAAWRSELDKLAPRKLRGQ